MTINDKISHARLDTNIFLKINETDINIKINEVSFIIIMVEDYPS